MKSENEMNHGEAIRIARYNIWRNLPSGVTTWSLCVCQRQSGRGGGPCLKCAEEKLAALTTPQLAADYVLAVRRVRELEENQNDLAQ